MVTARRKVDAIHFDPVPVLRLRDAEGTHGIESRSETARESGRHVLNDEDGRAQIAGQIRDHFG